MSENLVEVTTVDEFEDGDREIVRYEGAEIGVLNVEGSFYAVLNECRHDGGPVCTGAVSKRLVGDFTEPGTRVDRHYTDEPVISCPWHGWSYDLETGTHLGDDDICLPTFDVVVKDGTVYLDVSGVEAE